MRSAARHEGKIGCDGVVIAAFYRVFVDYNPVSEGLKTCRIEDQILVRAARRSLADGMEGTDARRIGVKGMLGSVRKAV